jgi:hypothetical protein
MTSNAYATKWVATVWGSGMGVSHLEAASREELETELGDMVSALGRGVKWTMAERPADWVCDGADDCV